ncbi:MAG: hypothetical protein J4445_01700 [DPANN group archaeon]|nr:hypothetical protein [DPANN group archaeon]
MVYKPKHLQLMLFGAALTPIAAIQLISISNSTLILMLTAFLVLIAGVAIPMGIFEHMRYNRINK